MVINVYLQLLLHVLLCIAWAMSLSAIKGRPAVYCWSALKADDQQHMKADCLVVLDTEVSSSRALWAMSTAKVMQKIAGTVVRCAADQLCLSYSSAMAPNPAGHPILPIAQ